MGGALTRRLGFQSVALILGNNGARDQDYNLTVDFAQGYGFQAPSSGTLNTMHILGHGTNDYTANYRLVIYAATSATVWSGAKLGETAQLTSLNANEDKSAALLVPVAITSGNWYAILLILAGQFSAPPTQVISAGLLPILTLMAQSTPPEQVLRTAQPGRRASGRRAE
jgi:hypothetical protein